MEETETEKTLSRVDQVLDAMQQAFSTPFFRNTDVRAACAVGALMSYATYLQESKFKTKALSKMVSTSFDHLNKSRLQSMFSAASSLIFKAMSKQDVRVSTKHRAFASELMTNADWSSHSEDLETAFVYGYDLFNKTRGETGEQESDK